MTEIMLQADTSRAHDFNYVALRYFNVAGADPLGSFTGQSTPRATHLIKVACETALGQRFRASNLRDHPTADGTLPQLHPRRPGPRPHVGAEASARRWPVGRVQLRLWQDSVLQVIDAVRRASNRDFEVKMSPRRPAIDLAAVVAAPDKIMRQLDWQPEHANLDQIVTWERKLEELKKGA